MKQLLTEDMGRVTGALLNAEMTLTSMADRVESDELRAWLQDRCRRVSEMRWEFDGAWDELIRSMIGDALGR